MIHGMNGDVPIWFFYLVGLPAGGFAACGLAKLGWYLDEQIPLAVILVSVIAYPIVLGVVATMVVWEILKFIFDRPLLRSERDYPQMTLSPPIIPNREGELRHKEVSESLAYRHREPRARKSRVSTSPDE